MSFIDNIEDVTTVDMFCYLEPDLREPKLGPQRQEYRRTC